MVTDKHRSLWWWLCRQYSNSLMFIIVCISRWWFDSHLLCPSLLGEMIQFDYTISFCTIFHMGGCKHLATRFGDWSSMMRSSNTGAVRGGNAELAAAVPGVEVVAGHKDAVTWWWTRPHTMAFFGFQTGPQTTTNQWSQFFLGKKNCSYFQWGFWFQHVVQYIDVYT